MTHNEIRSADVFLTRAIEKILGDKEVKRDQNAQLKEQLESILSNNLAKITFIFKLLKHVK